jgi:hypothetical protein
VIILKTTLLAMVIVVVMGSVLGIMEVKMAMTMVVRTRALAKARACQDA